MKKSVKLSIISSRKDDSAKPQMTELLTEGNYYVKDGIHYLTYDESKMTGMDGTTTTLKTDGRNVTLIRFGTTNSQFVFQKGRQHFGHYQTPYGNFSTCITPRDIDIMLDDTSGHIRLGYLIDFAGQSSENTFEIKYEIQA